MFLIAAIDFALITIVMLRVLSLGDLLRREPTLRLACASGFSCSERSRPCGPRSPNCRLVLLTDGPRAAGAFGFVGVAGLISSPLLGRASDRYGSRSIPFLGILLLVSAFVLLARANASVLYVVIAAVMTDIGNRAGLVANQNAIYALKPDACSRLNTAFMTSDFFGGAIGAVLAATLVGILGWWGLSVTGGRLWCCGSHHQSSS